MNVADTKFRVSIAKSDAIQQLERPRRVILAFSNGPSSWALLKMLLLHSERCQQSRRPTVCDQIDIVHVFNSHDNDNDEGSEWKSKVDALMGDSSIEYSTVEIDSNDTMGALLDYTQSNQIKTIILGDCSTRMAIKMLAYTADGRGATAPIELCGEYEIPESGVRLTRPLREFNMHEVRYFNQQFGLPTSDTEAKKSDNSILQLTAKFLTSLDAEYPSTVSTVMRTLEKLSVNSQILSDVYCSHCRMPVEKRVLTEDGTDHPLCYSCQQIVGHTSVGK